MSQDAPDRSGDWTAFQQSGVIRPTVNEAIAASWRRSKAADVPPHLDMVPGLDKDELLSRQRVASDFIASMGAVLQEVERHLADSGVMMGLIDTEGVVLQTAGDATAAAMLASVGLRPGAQCGETQLGTNCVALAIHRRAASRCVGAEHYARCMHPVAGSASPIYDLDGRLVGLLAGWAFGDSAPPALLHGLVMLTVTLANRQFRMQRNREMISRYRQITQGLFMPNADACIIVGLQGYIRQVNVKAMRLFNIERAAALEDHIDKIARFEPSLFEKACCGREVRDLEFEVTTERDRFIALVNGLPLWGAPREVAGTLLVFRKKQALAGVQASSSARYTFDDIVGESAALQRAKAAARIAATTDVNVLLEGESGTGKEMFAQAIHNESDRKNAPFITINCAAVPRELSESEFFGYGDGAFTGARRGGMIGKFEAADGGTIFLDEIGDLSLDIQSELLRVLETRRVTRVGAHEEIPVDIRVIAATNKKLLNEVENGNFREDLYYRLSVTKISLPSLAECVSDLPLLIERMIQDFNERMSRNVKGIADDILARMMNYRWPGNIRELKNAIQHAVMLCQGDTIQYAHLPDELREALLYQTKPVDRSDPLLDEKRTVEKIERDLQKGERELYVQALKLSGGNVSLAARRLGVGRATFYRKMKQFDIRKEDVLRPPES